MTDTILCTTYEQLTHPSSGNLIGFVGKRSVSLLGCREFECLHLAVSRSPSPEPKKSHSSDSLIKSTVGDGVYDEKEALYAPIVEEIRCSPVVSRKGYLNIMEEKTSGWKKQWVVSVVFLQASSLSHLPLVIFVESSCLRHMSC